jgi:NAD(P)-dependent dehydrogenase (short-subunit alcohol dehydrogenase family)
MFSDLAGKTALITGASGGLGLHFATVLAKRGVSVTLGARRVAPLEEACDAIRRAGGKASAVALDVTDHASIEAAVNSVPSRIDILVNNAGIGGVGAALELSEDDWDQVMATNLKGVFLTAQAAARRMKSDGEGGSIINIASILGLRVAGALAAYTSSKAAVLQLTRSLALEWARHRIRVNALCPGYIETDINRGFFDTDPGKALIARIPQRRLGVAEDLDAPLLMFASSVGSYITGAHIAVDGGHLVSTL